MWISNLLSIFHLHSAAIRKGSVIHDPVSRIRWVRMIMAKIMSSFLGAQFLYRPWLRETQMSFVFHMPLFCYDESSFARTPTRCIPHFLPSSSFLKPSRNIFSSRCSFALSPSLFYSSDRVSNLPSVDSTPWKLQPSLWTAMSAPAAISWARR